MDPEVTDRMMGLNIGNKATKGTDTFEEVLNASKVDRLTAIIEAAKSTLETIDRRVSKLEVRLDAMDEDAKRLRSSETSTRRDVGMESFTSVSRSEACTNRSITSISQHDSNNTTRMTPVRRTAPPSPKTMQIEMMMEEREEQERALEQIEDCYEETRLCPECSNRVNETCFRRHHFYWCTAHEKMTDENGLCPKTPSEKASRDIMRCSEVQCDKTEGQAYWAEVEENALAGGAGFRDPGEPHVH